MNISLCDVHCIINEKLNMYNKENFIAQKFYFELIIHR